MTDYMDCLYRIILNRDWDCHGGKQRTREAGRAVRRQQLNSYRWSGENHSNPRYVRIFCGYTYLGMKNGVLRSPA